MRRRIRSRLAEAPSSVTVVTAADIKTYGYRTLAAILRGIPGLYASYDRQYDFLGVRGFSRPGDFNARVLLLVDNRRQNQFNYDVDPHVVSADTHAHSDHWGVYLQDDVNVFDNLALNAGLRHDQYSSAGGSTSPRVALIWNPLPASAVKLIYGSAFRATSCCNRSRSG